MKKDIPNLRVEQIGIAIVPKDIDRPKEDLWDVFLINFKEERIVSVLVNSRGYGEIDGENIKTTVLRHFFDEVGPNTAVQVEPIQPKLFEIANEYWVSFVFDDHMFDKKYVFVKGSIDESNLIYIPLIDRRGVLIR